MGSFLAAARLASFCLLPLLLGCGNGPSTSDRWQIVERLSEPPDAEVFSVADVTDERLVRSWRLAEPAQAGLWQVEPATARGATDRRGLWLRGSDPGAAEPRLTAEVELDAPEVSVIELRLRNPSRAPSQLLWAAAGQEFTGDRRITLADAERDGDQRSIRVLRFRVGDHPEWRGTIRRLQIRPAMGSRRQFAVVSLRALRHRPDADLLAAAASRAWKVDLQTTIREARVTFPGQPWRTTIRVPDGEAELRFVPGLPAATEGEVELTVRSAQGDGDENLLASAAYSLPAGHDGAWQEPVRVPLTGFAAQELDLVFAMTATGSGRAAGGFAAWGNTQIAVQDRGPAPPNVVLICVDTLRADRLSAYGHDRQTSPRIDLWAAQRAVLFEKVVAPSPWTLPSFISIFTGLDSIRHGGNYSLGARPGLEMLAETLAREGYETAAWTGGGYLGPGHGLHRGFETFNYHLGEKDRELADNTERVIEWLGGRRDRPFFLLFHTYEVHSPYFERQPFYRRFAGDSGLSPIPFDWVAPRPRPRQPDDGFMVSREPMMSPDRGETWQQIPRELRPSVALRYDSGVAYADEQIGRVLDAIDKNGLGPRTVVVLTSDHGEGLGEHGLSGHSYLYDFNLLVPLIIAAPSGRWPGGHRVGQQVRSVDIVPTLRELVGLEPAGEMDGESLTPLVFGQPDAHARLAWSYAAVSNRGVSLRLPTLKYFFNNAAPQPVFAQERLFDLVQDPAELTDIADQLPAEAARFRHLVQRRLADEVAAVWFRLRSGSRYPLTVELAGTDMVRPSRLKALELPGDGVRYADSPEDRAIVELPAGTEALLYSEVHTGGTIRLQVDSRAPGLGPRRWTLQVQDLAARPWSALAANGAWTERRTTFGKTAPSLSVFTTHDLGARAGPQRTTQEIEQQLRALGYLQ